jgi:hypothetical protein
LLFRWQGPHSAVEQVTFKNITEREFFNELVFFALNGKLCLALRVHDGKELTRCAASRNSKGYMALLADIETDHPTGDIFIITDNLPSHYSLETRTWLEGIHASITSSFQPGQSFANPDEIEQAKRVATAQLNLRAKPWVWGRHPKTPHHLGVSFVIAF